MNFKRLTLILIVSAIGFFAFVTLSTPDKPPMPEVTYQGKSIKVLQGTYGWKTFTKGVQSDSLIPPEMMKNIEPTDVLPRSNLKVTFDYKPDDVAIMLWTEAGPQEYSIDHNTVITPGDKGIYVFEIRAKWNQGESSYAFRIKVN